MNDKFEMNMEKLLDAEVKGRVRHNSHEVQIGNVRIGGDNPVAIQTMTNTDTSDVEGTLAQILELVQAGAEMVRVTVNDENAAQAVPEIKKALLARRVDVPIIGDFHYNGHILLSKYPDCAVALDKYRINPGNVGTGQSRDKNFEAIINIALENEKPVRIGVNGGSLDRHLLQNLMELNSNRKNPLSARNVTVAAVVASAIQAGRLAEALGMPAERIVLSTKLSNLSDVIRAYKILAANSRYALHVGLTEAGMGNKGVVASTGAIAHLLLNGIGDTIRVSVTPEPGKPRTEEVNICQHILQTLELRHFRPSITSCPGCGRTTSTLFQELAQDVDLYIKERTPSWRAQGFKGFESLDIAVMGCVVNGPGESKNANIGISLPGTGENPRSPVYVDGKLAKILEGEDMKDEFKGMIEAYVVKNFSG